MKNGCGQSSTCAAGNVTKSFGREQAGPGDRHEVLGLWWHVCTCRKCRDHVLLLPVRNGACTEPPGHSSETCNHPREPRKVLEGKEDLVEGCCNASAVCDVQEMREGMRSPEEFRVIHNATAEEWEIGAAEDGARNQRWTLWGDQMCHEIITWAAFRWTECAVLLPGKSDNLKKTREESSGNNRLALGLFLLLLFERY